MFSCALAVQLATSPCIWQRLPDTMSIFVVLPQNDVHTGFVRKNSWYETCSWLPCEHLGDTLRRGDSHCVVRSGDTAPVLSYYPLTSSHLPTPQLLCVLQLYYQVAPSHLPAPPLLRALLKLYYNIASSQLLPTHQFSSSHSPATLRTKVVLPSRHFSSSSSPATPRTTVVL